MPAKPTPKQMRYLKTLAERTGQSFTTPSTLDQASAEIKRLLAVKPTPTADRTRELRDVQAAMVNERGDAARYEETDVEGYGSTARWSHTAPAPTGNPTIGERKELARYTIGADQRVVYGQRVHGVVRLTDCPTPGQRGRSFLIERGLKSKDELDAIVADYVTVSERGERPAALVSI
ncbi:MAG TPA: hypothetical protein VN238_01400 [Solirubrobacteraceae bacterium]|nr:hypothetical protein [Solirubrobacteraceae bacterium]